MGNGDVCSIQDAKSLKKKTRIKTRIHLLNYELSSSSNAKFIKLYPLNLNIFKTEQNSQNFLKKRKKE